MNASDPQRPTYPITVPMRALSRTILVVILALLAAHLVMWTYNYRVHELPEYIVGPLDVDNEQSLENAFSSFILAIAGGLTLAVAGRRKRDGDRDTLAWRVLAIGLIAMSLEEVAGIHESINDWQGGGWTTWGMVVAAAIGVWFIPFLRRLPSRTRWMFLIAGAAYVGGEMVVQKLEELFVGTFGGTEGLPYKFSAAVKEGGTLIGVWIYIRAILAYMSPGERGTEIEVETAR